MPSAPWYTPPTEDSGVRNSTSYVQQARYSSTVRRVECRHRALDCLHVLLRHRLFRQAFDLECLLAIVVVIETHHPPVAQLVDDRVLSFGRQDPAVCRAFSNSGTGTRIVGRVTPGSAL
jgi:hypothetical protein